MAWIEDMPISKITPYENNPRKNDDAVKYVANSIREFGFRSPIIVDRNNIIIAGHTRYKAAQELKLRTVPVIVADDLSEEQVKALRLADNKTGELAEWDFELLELEMGDILNLNMEDFGFEVPEILIDGEEDCYEVELPEVPKSKLGDIYQLGKHRLMCGDSASESDLDALKGGGGNGRHSVH